MLPGGSLGTIKQCAPCTDRIARRLLIAVAFCGAAAVPAAQDQAAELTVAPRPTARTARITSPALGSSGDPFELLQPTGTTVMRRYPAPTYGGGGRRSTGFPSRAGADVKLAAREMILLLPNGGRSFFANAAGLSEARYEDLIANDLVQYVDTHYRTLATREARAIAGISIGGLGSPLIAVCIPSPPPWGR